MSLDKKVLQGLKRQFSLLARQAGELLDYPVPANLTIKSFNPTFFESSPESIYCAFAAYATSAIYGKARPELLKAGTQEVKEIRRPINLLEDKLTFEAALWTITTTITPLMILKETHDPRIQEELQNFSIVSCDFLSLAYAKESFSLFRQISAEDIAKIAHLTSAIEYQKFCDSRNFLSELVPEGWKSQRKRSKEFYPGFLEAVNVLKKNYGKTRSNTVKMKLAQGEYYDKTTEIIHIKLMNGPPQNTVLVQGSTASHWYFANKNPKGYQTLEEITRCFARNETPHPTESCAQFGEVLRAFCTYNALNYLQSKMPECVEDACNAYLGFASRGLGNGFLEGVRMNREHNKQLAAATLTMKNINDYRKFCETQGYQSCILEPKFSESWLIKYIQERKNTLRIITASPTARNHAMNPRMN